MIDKKNDEVKFNIIPETTEESISVTYGCIRFIDSYSFLSSSLDSLVEILVDNSHKTLKNFKEEFVDIDEILTFVNGVVEEAKTIRDFKKQYPDKIEKLEEALLKCMGVKDFKKLKTDFPDIKWKYLTKKIAYPVEYLISLHDYQKPFENLKKKTSSVN